MPKVPEPEPFLTLGSAAGRAEAPFHLQDWQQQEVSRRLVVLCDWLDDQLLDRRPARAHKFSKNVRHVHVLDGLYYSIDYERRHVASGSIVDGQKRHGDWAVEIGRPLASSAWLPPILENLGLVNSIQGDLFFNASELDDIGTWLSDTAYRLLLRNPKFQDLRRITLPALFRIPRDIYGIALASRPRPIGPMIDSRVVNDVWRNERAFRQVARENAHLLPLLLAFVEQIPRGEEVRTKDPIKAVKEKFRASGISDASWRYVVRHGARIFRVPWEISNGQSHFEAATRYLEALQFAGLPPPPPPSVARAFLHGYNGHHGHDARVAVHFQNKIDPVVLRAGLFEADRLRQESLVDGFAEEFLGVCWWSEALPYFLDDNQAKAGWQWFVRRWREEEEAQALLEDIEPSQWHTRIGEYRIGQLAVVPINSSEALIRESLAMRNCLQTYLDECAGGDFEVYSVRESRTGKRKGCIGFRFDSDGVPDVVDIKGLANTPPKGEVREVAHDLLVKLWGMNYRGT